MKLRVECYAGGQADERPIRFQLDSNVYMVEEVLDQWCGPSDAFFKVRADDGNLTSCGKTDPRLTGCGVWKRSGNSRGELVSLGALAAMARRRHFFR